jgi:hypothetical protein
MTQTEQMVRDLRRRTKTLVDRKKIKRDRLAVDAGVSYFWLCRFLAEHEDALNPRVNMLARLEKSVCALERVQ